MGTIERLKESDRLWFGWVVPSIRDWYPGSFESTLGTDLDMQNGIDYIYTHNDTRITISARLWKSHPYQHFSMRYRRSIYPEMGLEIDSRLRAIKNGEEISDLTMEGFLYKGKLYMGIINTHTLYTAIDGMVPFLSEFYVQNTGPKDITTFKRAPFDLFHPEDISKIITPVIGCET
tara:strand:- start:432 stop:959 length:528 start_codon:yes stop_codon:yes gene_type:complete